MIIESVTPTVEFLSGYAIPFGIGFGIAVNLLGYAIFKTVGLINKFKM